MKKLLVLAILPLIMCGCDKDKTRERDPNTVDYVLIAEPALTATLKTTPNAKQYLDLQSEYKVKSENKILTQASVFVKSSLSSDVIHGAIENKIKTSIEGMLANPDSISTNMNKVDDPKTIFGVMPAMAVEAAKNGNRMGIGYKPGYEIKNDLNEFLSIFNVQPIGDEHIVKDAGTVDSFVKNDLKIVSPTGAPAIAMSAFADLDGFETNTTPANFIPMLKNNSVDVAVLPTNVGINAIVANNLQYKLLGTITFGNLYIASTGNDDDGIMDEDDYIVSFQQGAVPDKIFHYVFGTKFDNALHYVASNEDAAKCLKTGKNLTEE